MESRIIGSELDDFIFIESPKIILSINKAEKSIHVKAHKTKLGFVKAHDRKIKFEGKEIKKSHDFIQQKIGLNVDIREGERATKDPLMGEQIIIRDKNKNRLDIWIKETNNMIQLSTIGSEKKGTGIGTKYLLGLKKYADFSGKKLVIPDMTPSGKQYFSRFDWLVDDTVKLEYKENGKNEIYYPADTMSYTPKIKEVGVINKSEKGTHIGIVTVHGKTKTFKRKQRVGKKVVVKKPEIVEEKSSLDKDNLVEIKSFEDSGMNIVPGVHEEETYICKFKDGSAAIHKTMDQGSIIGEVGTYEISKIIGWNVIPETIQIDYGKGKGSSQKWIPDSEESQGDFDNGIILSDKHLDDLSKIFILDAINGNFDRHPGNIVIDKNDRVWAIDNECIGKKANAELHLESLESYAKNGEGLPTPIFGVLENSFGNDPKMYQKFKDSVNKNLPIVIHKSDEIMKYWNQYKNDDIKVFYNALPIKEGIKNIEKNINYLEKYRSEL